MSEITLGLEPTNKYEKKWADRFNELRLYTIEHGDANVPSGYALNKTLARWVSKQRTEYRKLWQGLPSSLTRARVAALEGLGFEWSMMTRSTPPRTWEEQLEELRQYKIQSGTTNVPKGYPPNPSLGSWVRTQRREYSKMLDGKQTKITAERIAELEELGFAWNDSSTHHCDFWEEQLEELRKYKRQHGDVNVPQRYHPYPSLGRWVNNQRNEYRKMQGGKPTTITAERVAELEELGFTWKTRSTPTRSPTRSPPWEELLEELRQYKKKYGDVNVPKRTHSNPTLGWWVSNVRSEYQKMQRGEPTKMTEERVAALEELGFVWK